MGALRRLALAATVLSTAACGEGGPEPRTRSVAIRGFAFDPAVLEVAAGDTVVWSNEDLVPHTATAAGREWDTGSIGAGESARVVVRGRGRQVYVCALHPGMRAEIVAHE
ncbi:MAG TPA: plastocyanin/azurin family copper-binding protein [Longimicrobiaceae bacterium]|nr:plastocyanin/azurin family copper-binding protein [Longimicrobiaceae bacterium]